MRIEVKGGGYSDILYIVNLNIVEIVEIVNLDIVDIVDSNIVYIDNKPEALPCRGRPWARRDH